jgi:hypothetical protein
MSNFSSRRHRLDRAAQHIKPPAVEVDMEMISSFLDLVRETMMVSLWQAMENGTDLELARWKRMSCGELYPVLCPEISAKSAALVEGFIEEISRETDAATVATIEMHLNWMSEARLSQLTPL